MAELHAVVSCRWPYPGHWPTALPVKDNQHCRLAMQELQSVYGLSRCAAAGALNLTVTFNTAKAAGCTWLEQRCPFRTLQDSRQHRTCYAAAHMVVIHTEGSAVQTILQGHCQPVSCLATSSDRSVIASADEGSASLLVLWDAQTANPFWTVPRPHSHGVLAMDLSPSGQYLVTLSAVQSATDQQQLAVWDISKAGQSPEYVAAVPDGDVQHSLKFSADGKQLVSNGKRTACFWQLTSTAVTMYSAPMSDSEYKHSTEELSVSGFLPDDIQVPSAAPCTEAT